jgi:hypothetical protein
MSSVLQSTLTSLQQNNYVSVAILSAVGYDYVLTFFDEIEYIWTKPWTWVSTLFILARYVGYYDVAINCILGSSLMPGHLMICKIIYVIAEWTSILFICAADLVMILRVWAMYNRSRLLLRALLILLSLEVIFFILNARVGVNPENVVTVQILDFSICTVPYSLWPAWVYVAFILQITHGVTTCILVTIEFVRQSLQMYQVTKQWQLNRYMSLLVKQAVLYFFVTLLYDVLNVLAATVITSSVAWQYLLVYVPMFTLTPRFILSIRRLYARDVHGRRGEGIDTGFGLSSSGRGAAGGSIVFADVEQNEDLEGIEEIRMEDRTAQSLA